LTATPAKSYPLKKDKIQGPQVGQLAWWRAELGDHPLADVTPAVRAEYRHRLALKPIPSPTKSPEAHAAPRCRGPATITRYLAALSHVFTVAVKEWQWVENNPALKVTKPKESRGRVWFLDDGERTRFLAACRDRLP
jgi:hypothetical protein